MKKLIALILSAVMLLTLAACGKPAEMQQATGPEVQFTFVVVDTEGAESTFEVKTNRIIVGEALQDEGLIAGEEGEYGLYVKTVNGITLDYDKDGKYWAFYIGADYAVTGVDKTEIVPGTVYSFKAE